MNQYTIIINSFYFIYLIKFIEQFQKKLLKYKIKTKVLYLPSKTKKFTVLKSPHVHKKSREQFEIKLYTLLIIFNLKKDINKIKIYLQYLNKGLNINFLPISLKIKETVRI